MSDSVTRFSSRVENYVKYRPSYPAGVLDILRADCGLTETATIADVGSGTGILAELLLRNGNPVIGVEPNRAMRQTAERLLAGFAQFKSVAGTAESTTLDAGTIDLVTAAQAFHWFDQERAKQEFVRILKPGGWVVLIWNERRLEATPFLREYEKLLLQYSGDYANVRHENVHSQLARFFAPETFRLKTLENIQHFDYPSLLGRTRSASYTPEPGDVNFEPLVAGLQQIFQAYESDGLVAFEYDTRVFCGHMKITPEASA